MFIKDLIKDIRARQILTSRGIPTVEVEFVLDHCSLLSSVPSGKSTGSKEACNLVDDGDSYDGRSVQKVVDNIKHHKDTILSEEIKSPENFDRFLIQLDGSKNKSVLGANFTLPLSICYYKFYSAHRKMSVWELLSERSAKRPSLPVPNFNVLNGGLHSGNMLACQEIMVCFNRSTYSENLEAATTFFHALKGVISTKFGSVFQSVGDEGGFAPPINKTEDGLELLIETGKITGITDFKVAFDFAANSFFVDGKYNFDGERLTGIELAERYLSLIQKYKMIYMIEDPFNETDYDSWTYFYSKAHTKINIVADDLTVTNPGLISKLAPWKMFNTVLIKPNQIGTVTETLEAIKLTNAFGYKVMVSHRSAETEDTFISSLAVGIGANYIKAGAPCRGERICKYNELLRIEESIKDIN